MANKPENNRTNQNTFKARMLAKGMVRLEAWVKEEHKEQIKEYIKNLTKQDQRKDQ